MKSKIVTIAAYTFMEATRNRMFLLTLAGLVAMLGLAEFTGELAITETREIQAILVAAVSRWFIVMTTALFVITTMVREFNDKGAEAMLSLPVSRTTYYFGKYAGFVMLAAAIALAVSLILLLYSPPALLAAWVFSLLCELLIIVALSMLCLFTFNNVTIAFLVVIAFYVLARSMAAIQQLSSSPILESHGISQEFMNLLLDVIAYLLPGLDSYTRAGWLVYGVEDGGLGLVIAQTVIYLGVLIAAGLFDLHRKEL
jgi:ABC-type transport system involved in multi-copper enzyme maturation permease subunit